MTCAKGDDNLKLWFISKAFFIEIAIVISAQYHIEVLLRI